MKMKKIWTGASLATPLDPPMLRCELVPMSLDYSMINCHIFILYVFFFKYKLLN